MNINFTSRERGVLRYVDINRIFFYYTLYDYIFLSSLLYEIYTSSLGRIRHIISVWFSRAVCWSLLLKVIIPFCFFCTNEFKNTQLIRKEEKGRLRRKIVMKWFDKRSLLHYTAHIIWLGQMIFTVAKKKRRFCIVTHQTFRCDWQFSLLSKTVESVCTLFVFCFCLYTLVSQVHYFNKVVSP